MMMGKERPLSRREAAPGRMKEAPMTGGIVKGYVGVRCMG